MKILINDQVQVIAGKDKNKSGKVLKVDSKSRRVLVQGVNKYKRHLKKQGNNPGGIVEVERALPISNVMLICPQCHKPARVGSERAKDGSKFRVCRRCQQPINDKKSA